MIEPVNKSEHMRARAWNQYRSGHLNVRDYLTLSKLALERHTIRDSR